MKLIINIIENLTKHDKCRLESGTMITLTHIQYLIFDALSLY